MSSIASGKNLKVLLSAFAVAIIALISVTGYMFVQNQNLTSGLENAVSTVGLKKGSTALSNVDALVGEINGTRTKVSTLQSQYDNLVNITTAYRKQIRSLESNNTSLSNTVSSQNTQIHALESNLTTLNSLKQQVRSLQADKASMQSKIDSLNQQVQSLQSLENATISLTAQVQTLKADKASMQGTIDSLNQQIFSLHVDMASLDSTINSLNQQITNLQSQIDTLSAPKLIGVNLNGFDNPRTGYLEVTGEVCNVGAYTAHNCDVHVMAYQSNILVIDKYIPLSDIAGEGWVSVNAQYLHTGFTLTSWNIIPEWS